MPILLLALAENLGAAIDNLDRAEKLGLLMSVDEWLEMRRLRNLMVHEYIEDLAILTSALQRGHQFVPQLVYTARNCISRGNKLLN